MKLKLFFVANLIRLIKKNASFGKGSTPFFAIKPFAIIRLSDIKMNVTLLITLTRIQFIIDCSSGVNTLNFLIIDGHSNALFLPFLNSHSFSSPFNNRSD